MKPRSSVAALAEPAGLCQSARISSDPPHKPKGPLPTTNDAGLASGPRADTEVDADVEPSLVGTIMGNYQIKEMIGRGGMGSVYRGQHIELRQSVAIKVLRKKYSGHDEALRRFFNEAKATTLIEHPGIVKTLDFGRTPEGLAFITMELLRGQTLAERIEGQTFSERRALSMIRQIASALAATHAIGIIHRDLKPDNVFLCPDPDMPEGERIKLLDFGIAKLTNPDETPNAKTQTGAVMGTPAYMSPEQCRAIKLDHRADLYSLGCMLFELISGRLVFSGEGAGDLIVAHISEPAPSLVKVVEGTTPAVADLTARLLAKAPEERPPSCLALMEAIDRVVAAGVRNEATVPKPAPKQVRPPSDSDIALAPRFVGTTTAKLRKPKRRIGKFVLLAGATVIGLAGFMMCRNSREASAPTKPQPAVVAVDAAPPKAPAPPQPNVPPTIPTTLTLHVTTTPANATVFVDNIRVGNTPLHWVRPPDKTKRALNVAVQLAGYREVDFDVPPTAVGDLQHVLTLVPKR